jgi:hypothetical protein
MDGMKIGEENESVGTSPWLLLMRDEIHKLDGELLARADHDDLALEVRHRGGSFWIIATWPSGARVA